MNHKQGPRYAQFAGTPRAQTARKARRGARLAALLLALTAVCAKDARAQLDPAAQPDNGSRVLVREQPCVPARYEPTELWRLLELELAGLGLRAERLASDETRAADAVADAAAVIAIECGAAQDGLVLRVSDLVSGKQLTRELSVADVAADARARAVALSATTLLESSLSELLAASAAARASAERALPPAVEQRLRERLIQNLGAPAPAPPVPAPPAPPVPAPPAPRAPARSDQAAPLRIDLGAVLRAFPGRGTGLLGLGFGLAPALGAALRLTLEAEVLYGKSDLADAEGKIGVMNLYWLAGGLGLSWQATGSPAFELGPRVLAGFALADADVERMGATATDESGFVLSVLLGATARWPLTASTQAALGAELGYTPVGIVFLGDQARLSGMADATFAVRIAIAWL